MFYLSLRKQPTLRDANSGISKWYLRNERNKHLSKIKITIIIPLFTLGSIYGT